MQIHKNEITTGLLVLGTMAIFGVVFAYTALPGVLKPINTFRIYFDNLNGLSLGAPVLLGGRQIGKVSALESPIPVANRPGGHPDYEVAVDVEVDRSAHVYHYVTVRLLQQGLMGQEVIDFVRGDETRELAANHTEFVGQRVPDLSEAMEADIEKLTGENSDLALIMKHLKTITADDSNLSMTIKNVNAITSSDSDLSGSLKSLKALMEKLDDAKVTKIISNTEEMSETLKREPWRLLWPGTKGYPGDPKPVADEKPAPDKAPETEKPTGDVKLQFVKNKQR